MNKTEQQVYHQTGAIIHTLSQRRGDIVARIYSEAQRSKINELISLGYIPIETVVGKAKCTKQHWNLEPYTGRRGDGFRMISSYPSSNFNSITFFIKKQAA